MLEFHFCFDPCFSGQLGFGGMTVTDSFGVSEPDTKQPRNKERK